MKAEKRKLHAGDWVQVRSKEDILKTLDSSGQLDGMPFMPEMFAFCGQRFRVYKRAHKTCDTVFPVRGRRVHRAVHLETRCDGKAHGGCQAGCLLFWKEAWLTPVSTHPQDNPAVRIETRSESANVRTTSSSGCSQSSVWANTQMFNQDGRAPIFICQATRLPYATTRLEWWDIRQYLEDYTSSNVSLGRIFSGWVYSMYYNLSMAGIGLGRPMRWLYDTFGLFWGGKIFPRKTGIIREGEPTPVVSLDLQPGELVRVKSHEEILRTVNTQSRNRGLLWDAEMVPYCGGTYRVLKRVTDIIDEKTGMMQKMKNTCIILDSVVCQGRYSGCRMFCPRSIYPYWREIWLERVESPTSDAEAKGLSASTAIGQATKV